MSLAGALLSGDVRALARAISLAEDRDPQATELVAELQAQTGKAFLVGLTGSPGTGKSTLADALVKVIRDRKQTGRLIQDAIALGPKQAWRPPIVLASAAKEEGIEPVWDAVLAHQAYLTESGALAARRQQRLKQEVVALVAERARDEARRMLDGDTA